MESGSADRPVSDGVDETQTRAWEQLTEYRVLLDLTMERLVDLQRDFLVLQEQMVKCYAMLPALAPPAEPCQEQPAANIWGDQSSA